MHFIDASISAYDGMAAVRRDFRVLNGRTMYKVYVSPGMEDEFLEVMARLRDAARRILAWIHGAVAPGRFGNRASSGTGLPDAVPPFEGCRCRN